MALGPTGQDRVLDLCAAPGSKTSQMAAMMQNQGEIVALDSVRPRYFKLKANLNSLGVTNTKTFCVDARRFRTSGRFNKILVDAP